MRRSSSTTTSPLRPLHVRKSFYGKSSGRFKKILAFAGLILAQILLTFFILTSGAALEIILLIGIITVFMFLKLVI